MLHAFCPLCSPRCIHRRISAADDHNVLSDIKIAVLGLEVSQELKRIHCIALLQPQHTGLRRACCHDDGCIICIFQHIDLADLRVQADVDAHLLKERSVLIDRTAWNTKFRDHMAHHAAQGVVLLEQCDLHACPSQEIRRSHSRRAASDHGCLSCSGDSRSLQLLHERIITVFCRDQLHAADIDRFLIEVTGTFSHTCM